MFDVRFKVISVEMRGEIQSVHCTERIYELRQRQTAPWAAIKFQSIENLRDFCIHQKRMFVYRCFSF